MVISILEAHVEQKNWEKLKDMYQKGASNKPKQLIKSYLIQNEDDRTFWRGMSIGNSKQELDEYRKSVSVPAGILMFSAAGAEHTFSVYDILVQV